MEIHLKIIEYWIVIIPYADHPTIYYYFLLTYFNTMLNVAMDIKLIIYICIKFPKCYRQNKLKLIERIK